MYWPQFQHADRPTLAVPVPQPAHTHNAASWSLASRSFVGRGLHFKHSLNCRVHVNIHFPHLSSWHLLHTNPNLLKGSHMISRQSWHRDSVLVGSSTPGAGVSVTFGFPCLEELCLSQGGGNLPYTGSCFPVVLSGLVCVKIGTMSSAALPLCDFALFCRFLQAASSSQLNWTVAGLNDGPLMQWNSTQATS